MPSGVYARYVSKSLRASIARQIASPDGMEADYFVKAQEAIFQPPSSLANWTESRHGFAPLPKVTTVRAVLPRPQVYARYVSKSLRASIARQIASPDGMEADYFVKASSRRLPWPIGRKAAMALRRCPRSRPSGQYCREPWPRWTNLTPPPAMSLRPAGPPTPAG
jgi:hypothetical protein